MVTMLIVKCNESSRKAMLKLLPLAHCEVETEGWVDGSTAWGIMVACFVEHAHSGALHQALRDLGFSGWLKVTTVPLDGSFA